LSSLARRYVLPLFELSRDAGTLDRTAEDLKVLDDALTGSPDLAVFLAAPTVERVVKRVALEQIFKSVSPLTLQFLRVVVTKNRTEILHVSHRIFTDLLNAHRGIVPGSVETASPLDDTAFAQLQKVASAKFGVKVELTRSVDPTLLGGMKVRVGNKVVDASVRGRLEKLRTVLKGE